MRTFDYVDEKLIESDFFLQKMQEDDVGWFEIRCYFSAFVSSLRSVTFALQASMNGVDGFEGWYGTIQESLRQDNIARFFHNCRTDNQKIGFNHIIGGWSQNGKSLFFFSEPSSGQYPYVPETDVVTICLIQMKTICGIVDKAYEDFGLIIDPDQIYTPEGLKALGWTLEEIEASIGLPEGFTDIPWDAPDKDLQRLALLRRNIPGSSVKPLLRRYLGRGLNYPSGPYTVI